MKKVKELSNIKGLMLKSLIEYYEGSNNNLLKYKEIYKRGCNYIRNKISIFISKLNATIEGFKAESTIEELKRKLVENK